MNILEKCSRQNSPNAIKWLNPPKQSNFSYFLELIWIKYSLGHNIVLFGPHCLIKSVHTRPFCVDYKVHAKNLWTHPPLWLRNSPWRLEMGHKIFHKIKRLTHFKLTRHAYCFEVLVYVIKIDTFVSTPYCVTKSWLKKRRNLAKKFDFCQSLAKLRKNTTWDEKFNPSLIDNQCQVLFFTCCNTAIPWWSQILHPISVHRLFRAMTIYIFIPSEVEPPLLPVSHFPTWTWIFKKKSMLPNIAAKLYPTQLHCKQLQGYMFQKGCWFS